MDWIRKTVAHLQRLLHGTGGSEYDLDNGADAFDGGLPLWLERAPEFNARHVKAPLRLQVATGGYKRC